MWLYRLILALATPWIVRRVFRFRKQYPNYRLAEALGRWGQVEADLWLHCASVGEVLAAKALINLWLEQHPSKRLLITTVTPTGAEQVEKWFSNRVVHRYLPLDYGVCVRGALRQLTCPQLAIIETELWPNLLSQVKAKGMNVQIINARMSARSARGYERFRFISRKLMSLPDAFLAHAQADAERFKVLGARHVSVVGNIKFDIQIPQDPEVAVWHHALAPSQEFVWVAASTHEGEDALFLSAHQMLLKHNPNAKLILVPRHPERFDQVFTQMRESGLLSGRRSVMPIQEWHALNVLLGDSMGEMMRYYGVADVAVVGGSFIQRGGHNPIEPAMLAKPVIVGEHTFNFADITNSLIDDGGAIRVLSVTELSQQLERLEAIFIRQSMGKKAQQNALSNQGALARVIDYLKIA